MENDGSSGLVGRGADFFFNIGWIFMLVRDWWVYRSEVNYLSFRVKLALGMREHAQERREGLQRP